MPIEKRPFRINWTVTLKRAVKTTGTFPATADENQQCLAGESKNTQRGVVFKISRERTPALVERLKRKDGLGES
ncbi:hypothetical protein SAMN02745866_00286 [Alteromonadaceae bacterium Bs31]|nr:hypothetical protein SAMN02745866_00286 [Alteromonadaceae bacterium Bs31]